MVVLPVQSVCENGGYNCDKRSNITLKYVVCHYNVKLIYFFTNAHTFHLVYESDRRVHKTVMKLHTLFVLINETFKLPFPVAGSVTCKN